jgi:hypothetical protein
MSTLNLNNFTIEELTIMLSILNRLHKDKPLRALIVTELSYRMDEEIA